MASSDLVPIELGRAERSATRRAPGTCSSSASPARSGTSYWWAQEYGGRGWGQFQWVLYRQARPQGSCFPLLWFLCMSVCLLALPLFWTHSHLLWGWGQVSIQSADAQEQVEGLLAENNALRTSLAALEQVQDTLGAFGDPSPVPLLPLLLIHVEAVYS